MTMADEIKELSGVLILNKEAGITSHDAVNRVRRLFGTKQVGHAGTLDPMATGVLPILVGRAAKAAEYLTNENKVYSALLKLGIVTDTEDISGKVLSETSVLPKEAEVQEACTRFVGDILQVPPMYSALKVNGQKLYELARKNIEIERQPRPITVYSLKCETVSEASGLYRLSVHCSKGCYIRTLCADIGKTLGCGGCMAALERLQAGNFCISESISLSELEELLPEERILKLKPIEQLFSELPAVSLSPFFGKLASSGCPVYQKKIGVSIPSGRQVRLYKDGVFFALGEAREYPEGMAIKAIKQFVLFTE